mmetsp:Transcript_25602/g.48808  ORF Transcript_25602/g.48808 Transcript_25602/m.48808 type:complete len:415 (+) Transcript_25602:143-1387(+)
MEMILSTSESDNKTKCCDRIIPAEQIVQKYLDSFLENPQLTCENNHDDKSTCFELRELNDALPLTPQGMEMGTSLSSFGRITCCKSSQSLYCKYCLRLLVPDCSLPLPISRRKRIICDGSKLDEHCSEGRPLKLPFNLHIVLDDRRGSATGLHAVALLNERKGLEEKNNCQEVEDISQTESDVHNTNANSCDEPSHLRSLKLIDLANGDEIPKYRRDDATTFLLFPSPGESVPLESVASKVQTLVVLDCKWTKNKRFFRKNQELSTLQKVHLSSPPQESYYWRWHNAGPGMISTIEAMFYAAYEVSRQKYQCLLESNQKMSPTDSNNYLIDQNNLIHLLWLFGHQRATTFKAAQNEGVPAPWSDEEKARQREMRKQKGTWRQLRHKEDEKRLMERNQLKEEKNRLKEKKKESTI